MATILIVDDDAGLRDGLSEAVSDFGHASRLAASGREALSIVASEAIDGVLAGGVTHRRLERRC